MKRWRMIVSVICALLMFITAPGMNVVAGELHEEIVVAAEDVDSENAGVPESQEKLESAKEESVSDNDEKTDEENIWEISDAEEIDGIIEQDVPEENNLGDIVHYTEEEFTDLEVSELEEVSSPGSDNGFEVYCSDALINGLEESNMSLYDTLMGTDMIYQQLAEYAMEEKALYYSSGLWLNTFEDIFQSHPQYLYETILMAYLNFDANSAETEDTAKQAVLEFAVDLASFALSQAENTTEEWNNLISTTPKADVGNMIMNGDLLGDASDIFDSVVLFSENAEELVNNLASIAAVDKKRTQQIAFLEDIKAQSSDNEYLQDAIGDIIDIYKDVDLVSLYKQTGRQAGFLFAKELPDAAWATFESKIRKLSFGKDLVDVIAPIYESAEVGASGLNALFGTKALSKDLMAILTVYIIDENFREGLRVSRQTFLNSPTRENAIKFNGAFDSYLDYQIYASQVSKQYIHDIINSGLLTKTFAQIFYTENIENAEALTALCDSQMNIRKQMATIKDKYYSIYCGKYGLSKYVEAVSSPIVEPVIPVTGISFARKSRTIQMDNTWAEVDDVVIEPSNATNQGFKITSSDESILTVNSLFRWMTPVKPGTVTITVTSDDGGFTATQTVMVADTGSGADWTEEYPYEVGDNVWAKIDNNTVYFYSHNGTLSKDWKEEIAKKTRKLEDVTRITVSKSSGKLYLPEDSSYLFSQYYGSPISGVSEIELDKVDTSKVTNMSHMFYIYSSYNKITALDTSNFNTTKVTKMDHMFRGCNKLKSLNLSSFDTSNVTDMQAMFYDCGILSELNLSNFDTSKVTCMKNMFNWCGALKTLELSGFNTSKVMDMSYMFSHCASLENLDFSRFDTSSATNMKSMFYCCSSLTDLNLSHFDTSRVTNMEGMFYYCGSLTHLDVSSFDTSNVTEMNASYAGGMFENCKSLTYLDLHSFDTSKVTCMDNMFAWCQNLKTLDLSSFNTENVTSMSRMFDNCIKLKSIELSSFDTSNVESASEMFDFCNELTTLDLSNFDISSLKKSGDFLGNCYSLNMIKTPKNGSTSIILPRTFYEEVSGEEYTSLPLGTRSIVLRWQRNINTCTIILSDKELTYDGGEIEPLIAVKYKESILKSGDDYVYSYSNNIKPGTATITVYGRGKYSDSKTAKFTIEMAKPKLMFEESEVVKLLSGKEFTNKLSVTTDGLVTYKSSNTSVATVNNKSGKVTIKGVGQTIITATAAKGVNYKSGSTNFTLTVIRQDDMSDNVKIKVGDGVKATFNKTTGTIEFYSDEGVLWKDWMEESGFDGKNIKSIKVVSGTVYLPDDSSNIFTIGYYDDNDMFASNLKVIDLSGFNTSKVTDMSYMFSNCFSLTDLDLSNFNTSKVTWMEGMFLNCENIESIKLDNIETSNVKSMDSML